MLKRKLSDLSIQMIVGAMLFLAYLPYIFSQHYREAPFVIGDSQYYRATVVSLLEDGDLNLSNNVRGNPYNGFLALGKSNDPRQLVPKHPILLPLCSLPFFALMGNTGLLVFNVLQLLLLFMVIYRINRLFFAEWISFLTTLWFGVATLFLNYSYNYSPDVLSSLLLLSGVYLVLRQRYAWAAALLGLAVFAKLPNLPLVLIVCLYVVLDVLHLQRETPFGAKLKKLALFAAFFLAALVPLGLTNQRLYGAPWATGYHRTVREVVGRRGGAEVRGIALDNHTKKFNQPLFEGLFRLLLDREKGLLTTNPILFLSLIGVVFIYRHASRIQLGLLLLLCLAQLLFFAKYDEWDASHYSNRFLMSSVALLSVFASNLIDVFLKERTERG